jgi:methylase of polypeptide subunit release factors
MTPIERLHSLRRDNDSVGDRMDAMRARFDTYRDRHTNGTAPRVVTAHQLFQTPRALAGRMVALAKIDPHHRVLEPSAGLGRILAEIMPTAPATVTACEKSPDCCRELFQNFPDVELWQGDFLERSGTFDRIVMNPPFTMRSDIKHTRHALAMLAPGGILVGLCLSTDHREKALKPLADVWDIIPAGTFRESNTGVETVLFRITV